MSEHGHRPATLAEFNRFFRELEEETRRRARPYKYGDGKDWCNHQYARAVQGRSRGKRR